MVWQAEKCPKSGKTHFQGYFEFEKPVHHQHAINTLRREKIHVEPQGMYTKDGGWFPRKPRPTRSNAREYCMKEDSRVAGPWELGVFDDEPTQGKRSDLVRCYDLVNEFGWNYVKRNEEKLGVVSTLLTNGRTIKANYLERLGLDGLDTRPMEVWIILGRPGNGKTTEARKRFNNKGYIVTPPRTYGEAPWFQGYKCEEDIILDEMKPNRYPLDWLLRFLDEHPMYLEIKGDSVQNCARRIIITTNDHPSTWYDWSKPENNYEALMRRVTRGIIEWKGYPGWKEPVGSSPGGNTMKSKISPPGRYIPLGMRVPPTEPNWKEVKDPLGELTDYGMQRPL